MNPAIGVVAIAAVPSIFKAFFVVRRERWERLSPADAKADREAKLARIKAFPWWRRRGPALLVALAFVLVWTIWHPQKAFADESSSWWQDVLVYWWNWLQLGLLNLGNAILGVMVNNLSQRYVQDLSTLSPYIAIADAWFPVGLALGLLADYYAFLLLFVLGKLILKLIPGIG